MAATPKGARAKSGHGLYMVYFVFRSLSFLAVLLYRLSFVCTKKGWLGKSVGLVFWRLNAFVSSCDLDPQAKIGAGLYLPHPMGVVIGRAVIGRNVQILQSVTIGIIDPGLTTRDCDPDKYPRIGDNVVICAGAVVAGAIKIGDGALIGANAVVLHDVPENCTAVGVPARILSSHLLGKLSHKG
jgi:serine O-acetyltransferase